MYITPPGVAAPAPPVANMSHQPLHICHTVAQMSHRLSLLCNTMTLVVNMSHYDSYAFTAWQLWRYNITYPDLKLGPLRTYYLYITTSALSVTNMQLHKLLQTETNRDQLLTLWDPLKRPLEAQNGFAYPYPIKTRSVILRFLSNENNDLQELCTMTIPAMSYSHS